MASSRLAVYGSTGVAQAPLPVRLKLAMYLRDAAGRWALRMLHFQDSPNEPETHFCEVSRRLVRRRVRRRGPWTSRAGNRRARNLFVAAHRVFAQGLAGARQDYSAPAQEAKFRCP